MLGYFTIADVKEMEPCPERTRILKLFAGRDRVSFSEAIDLPIWPSDLFWLFSREGVLNANARAEFACRAAERIMKFRSESDRETDRRSRRAVEAVRKYMRGEIGFRELSSPLPNPLRLSRPDFDPLAFIAENAIYLVCSGFGYSGSLDAVAVVAAVHSPSITDEQNAQIADLRELVQENRGLQ